MAKKASEYSFSYVPQIEDERLDIHCKLKGKLVDSLRVDLNTVKDLTFKDEDFGGGEDTPYTMGDWLPLYGLWIHLSARTSSKRGADKLTAMKEVLAMHIDEGRFKAERVAPPKAPVLEIRAIARLRTEDGKETSEDQVKGAWSSYTDEQWTKIKESFGDRLPKMIEKLKGEQAAAKSAGDGLFDYLLDEDEE